MNVPFYFPQLLPQVQKDLFGKLEGVSEAEQNMRDSDPDRWRQLHQRQQDLEDRYNRRFIIDWTDNGVGAVYPAPE